MNRKRTRRICRVLYALAIAVEVIAAFGIVCFVLLMANNRAWAILPLVVCFALAWVTGELAESIEKRM